MALRLDLLLILGSFVVLIWAYLGENKTKNKPKLMQAKEMVFTNTNFSDVNQTAIISNSFGTSGERINGVLYVDNLLYKTDTIHFLKANKGEFREKNLYLRGDVFIDQKEGSDYKTQYAIHDTVKKVVHVPGEFETFENNSSVKGKTMTYNMQKKEIMGERIKAIIETKKK